jgi:hypothetical protein
MGHEIYVVQDESREAQLRGIFATQAAAERALQEHRRRYAQQTGEIILYRLDGDEYEPVWDG